MYNNTFSTKHPESHTTLNFGVNGILEILKSKKFTQRKKKTSKKVAAMQRQTWKSLILLNQRPRLPEIATSQTDQTTNHAPNSDINSYFT